MYIVIICFQVYEAIKFEINFSFPNKSFFFMTKKTGQKFKYLKNQKSS